MVGARDLWETYLPVFEACIGEGMGQSVMCSYNSINGIPACGHKGMLADVLRGHMGFKGVRSFCAPHRPAGVVHMAPYPHFTLPYTPNSL